MVIFPATLKATAFLVPSIYLVLWYQVSFVTTGLLLPFGSCVELHPILKGTLLATVLTVVLAGVLVPSLELAGEDVHVHELLPPFVKVF